MVDGILDLAAEDALLRLGDRDAVRERAFAQIRVDEPCGDAELVGRDDRGEILNAVLHHDADGIAALKTGRHQKLGIAVRQGIELRPCDLLFLGDYRREVPETLRVLLDRGADAIPVAVRAWHHAFFQRQQRGQLDESGKETLDVHRSSGVLVVTIDGLLIIAQEVVLRLRA